MAEAASYPRHVEAQRYRLVERIGQGGMATVWRAEDSALGRHVAVKVLLPFVAERAEASERFAREARALAGIRHPNVLQLFDYLPALGDEPARLVMELLAGPSLHRFVVDAGTPLPEIAALIGAEVAAGLAAVHARGIVHRDVKPENVILDGGRIVLTDFGIAHIQLADRTALTAAGAIIGSPAYMSPEQARGDDVDARSDQFSLGSLMYFLATGAAPFAGPHPLVVMQKIDRCEFQPLGAKNARVPAWLDRIVRRCLSRDPEARYADAGALSDALRRGLADDGLDDPAAELRRYFSAPPAYNGALVERIVPRRLADAEAALDRGDRTRALASIERVLQLDPGHARARSLFERLSRRRERRTLVWLAAAMLTLALAGPLAWLRWHAPSAPRPIAVAPEVIAAPNRVEPPPVDAREREPARGVAPQATDLARLVEPKPTDPAKGARPRPPHAMRAAAPPAATSPVVTEPPPPTEPPPRGPVAADTPAQLSVHTSPWCELTVDGRSVGRTPQRLQLPPGSYALSCKNPAGGRFDRTIALAPGASEEVRESLATVELRLSLRRGDAVAVDRGPATPSPRPVGLGRRHIDLYSAGQIVDTAYVEVRASGCRLTDTPTLHCESP